MREIKFRGKCKSGRQEWVYGYYFHCSTSDTHNIHSLDDSKWPIVTEVIPETVGQFADLHGKNGKDLDWWEGDIFARSSDRKIEGVVVLDMGCFWLQRERGGRTPLYEGIDWSLYKIGTIHENPELLEGKSNE